MRPSHAPPPRPFELTPPALLPPGSARPSRGGGTLVPLYRGWSWVQPPEPVAGRAVATQARTTALVAAVHAGLRTDHWFYAETAALVWGCDTVGLDGRVHLVQRHTQQRGAHPEVRRHCATLRDDETTTVDALPVTGLARTVVDCARLLTARQALVVADSALRRGLPHDALDPALERAQGARGIRRAREVLRLADARSESPGESLLRLVVLQSGLPVPELQIPVDTSLGLRYVDLGWSELRVAVEFDGRTKYASSPHGPEEAFYEEKRRQDALEELGWLVVRVMWEDLGNPDALVARLRAALHRQHRRHARP